MVGVHVDIYNLGDLLGDMGEQFGLSYIENVLTSNSILASLATHDIQHIYHLVDMVKGKEVATSVDSKSKKTNQTVKVLKV